VLEEESEPAAEELLQLLRTIPRLKADFEKVKLGHPVVGSNEYRDRLLAEGERPGIVASMKLSVAADHLLTWNRIIFDGRFIPAWSHFSLLRPVLEASVQSRFLLDPLMDARTARHDALMVLLLRAT
jgi:hypothetical protein